MTLGWSEARTNTALRSQVILVLIFHSENASIVFLVMPGTRDDFYIALIKPQALVPAFWYGVREVLRSQVFYANELGAFLASFLIDVLGDDCSIHFLLTGDLFEQLDLVG